VQHFDVAVPAQSLSVPHDFGHVFAGAHIFSVDPWFA
jgi:hypothetical protein